MEELEDCGVGVEVTV